MCQFYLNKRLLTFFLISSLFLGSLKAQDDCTTTLSKAQKLYDAGVIEQIPQMLQLCLNKGFSEEEKLQAYKLIIMSYLFDNNSDKADKAMLDFLKRYPEYELLSSDPAEFVELFKTYRTYPKAALGFILGTNISNVHATYVYGNNKLQHKYHTAGFTYQGGISYKRYLIDKLDLNIEGIFTSISYRYNEDSSKLGNTLDFTETMAFIELPITAVYTPFNWKIGNPYLRGGFSCSYLLNSSAILNLQIPGETKPRTEPATDITNNRVPFQVKIIIGAGINFKLNHSNWYIDIRYLQGLQNPVIANKRIGKYDKTEFNYHGYGYIDNDMKISNLYFSVGYFYKFYKPEKKVFK